VKVKAKQWGALLLAVLLTLNLAGCGQSGNSFDGSKSAILNEVAEVERLSVNAEATIYDLKTDGMTNPLGLDDETPAFSWKMQSSVTGAAQKAYHVVVKDAAGSSVWDSGTVESADSVGITYEGEALEARSAYTWTVEVTDTADNTVSSEEATFETGLMSTSKDAWEGADFIGADELSVDAASLCAFKIVTGFQIVSGDKAQLVIGAGDFRLENESFNVNRAAGEENYVKIEFDFSGVTAEGGAKINVYRYGYSDADTGEPTAVVENSDTLNSVITSANAKDAHELTVSVVASKISFNIDGTDIFETVTVNDLGGDSSYNTYPNLGSIGFAADQGEKVEYTDYRIDNGGDYGTGTLFAETVGATYAIFDGADGLGVSGSKLTVDGSKGAVLTYADPSYAGAPMLRRAFELSGDVASARLYITAQGIYNFYMNGQEVAADQWFNPGSSEYDQLLGYNVYDVTEYLASGENVMGAVLGEGYWTGQMTYDSHNNNYFGDQPALMAMLKVTYTDGSEETVITDTEWNYYGEGPVILASMFQGERYDATREAEVEGWSEAGYDESAWRSAAVIETRKQFANFELVTRTDTPVHVIRENTVVEALGEALSGSDSYIYDMGENVSGVPEITIPAELAEEGKTIIIRYAEILYPELDEYVEAGINGMLMVENYRAALVTDFYTMKAGEQTFVPDLTQHGYRYIEITGLGAELPAENIKTLVLSSVDTTSTYESSNELANQLFKNIQNSTTSNYISLPTDCPQRNERMGWTGDAQIFALTGAYIADTYNFMSVWMDTVRADSGETGMSSQYCPAFVAYDLEADETIPHNGQSFGITWNALVVTIPYNLYMQTGRLSIVEENIDNIYAYIDTLTSTPLTYKDAKGEKQTVEALTGETGTLADHLARVGTNSVLLGNCVYIACLDEAAVMAEAVGDTEKAAELYQKAADARTAWNEVFIDSKTGKTVKTDGEVIDTQASYATPLRFGIISESNLEKVLVNYNATIAEASGEDTDGVAITPYTLTTGFNATGNVLNALSDYGLNDTAYQLFENTEYASWLFPVSEGATSIWERWNSYTEDGGFNGNNSMNSFNHYSYGAVGEWMLGYQAGILANDGHAGFRSFILQPTVGGTFTDLTVTYETDYGTIKSAWTAADGAMTSYDVTVPANTTATLYLPTSSTNVTSVEGATYVESTEHNAIPVQVFQLVAGSYHFEISGDAVTVTAAATAE